MQNTNRLVQKWACSLVTILAVTFFTGCEAPKQESSTTTAAAPTTPAAAPTPVAAPAAPAEAAPAPAAAPSGAVAVTPPVRIDAGVTDKVTDSEGNVWLPDEGCDDGEVYEVADADVTGTKDPDIFRTERYSMSAYNFKVPNGKYTVKLLFAEVFTGITGPGDRVFSFNVQGHEFKDFDIWVKAGGPTKLTLKALTWM